MFAFDTIDMRNLGANDTKSKIELSDYVSKIIYDKKA